MSLKNHFWAWFMMQLHAQTQDKAMNVSRITEKIIIYPSSGGNNAVQIPRIYSASLFIWAKNKPLRGIQRLGKELHNGSWPYPSARLIYQHHL